FSMSGIAPIAIRQGVRIARPMLACSRDAISAWAHDNHIAWREDHTNMDARFMRNRVRSELLPQIEHYGAHVRRSIARGAEILRSDAEYLDALAARQLDSCLCSSQKAPEVLLIERECFNASAEALRRHMIKVLASRLQVSVGYDGILRMMAFMRNAAAGKQLDFGGGAMAYVDKTHLHVTPPGYNPGLSAHITVPMTIPGETRFTGCRFNTQVLAPEECSLKTVVERCDNNCQYFDLDGIMNPVLIRTRRPGDRMRPLGMTGHKKIQDIMSEHGVPRYLRDRIPLVVVGDEILWLAGYRRGIGAMLTERSKRILEIRLDDEHQ
ncbi:MAG TPA: hypothetical protein ENN29_08920, partial [Candidatus Hydrogenedentes bacterium]|nr:hypothetical protein [Candidatus Hydrogenedentota bacterium]